ncbi:hypothetical protein NDU88_005726 [Pleurodeles waltl]|uniref:Uncharacterized protein n=1 Tax=Pleurodeles waltl TaxID=8319 RepID=A0AAV7WCM7_PLEWA|nr:hypothetical protein NDU88_005726 [Pleurodeles waltl]
MGRASSSAPPGGRRPSEGRCDPPGLPGGPGSQFRTHARAPCEQSRSAVRLHRSSIDGTPPGAQERLGGRPA